MVGHLARQCIKSLEALTPAYGPDSHCGITPSPYRGIQLVEWFNMVVVVLVTRVSK